MYYTFVCEYIEPKRSNRAKKTKRRNKIMHFYSSNVQNVFLRRKSWALNFSRRNKSFRGVSNQRKNGERDFRCFSRKSGDDDRTESGGCQELLEIWFSLFRNSIDRCQFAFQYVTPIRSHRLWASAFWKSLRFRSPLHGSFFGSQIKTLKISFHGRFCSLKPHGKVCYRKSSHLGCTFWMLMIRPKVSEI